MPIFRRILVNEEVLDVIPSRVLKKLVKWSSENIFNENVLTLENWLEVAFHLNKQRWDQSIDWLETQPMSKIKIMMEINKKFAEEQEAQMKKSSKKR
jgi:hypothetical protein